MNETVLRSGESLGCVGGGHLDQHKGKDLSASRIEKSTVIQGRSLDGPTLGGEFLVSEHGWALSKRSVPMSFVSLTQIWVIWEEGTLIKNCFHQIGLWSNLWVGGHVLDP